MNDLCRHSVIAVLLGAVLLVGCRRAESPEVVTPPETASPAVAVVRPVAIVEPRPTEPLPPGTTCVNAGCHAQYDDARFVHGVMRAEDGCAICHEDDEGGHVYPLKLAGSESCTFCHESIIGERIHAHGATAVQCTVCHDPHASDHVSLLREASVSTLCAACHPESHPEVPHGPFAAGECVACHDPHESDFDGLLRGGDGVDHCALCHEGTFTALSEAAFVHPPATDDCLSCHAPHGSDHPFGLEQDVDETCFSCHADIEKIVKGAGSPHGALRLDAQCGNCHDAHASDRPALLKAGQDVLCLACHDQPIEAEDGRTIPDMAPSIRDHEFLHGPVASGHCTACHNVHGGTHSRLLVEEFTESFYTAFDIRHYALCFSCHEEGLVTEAQTAELTSFRDGDRNLHFLHVNRDEKGRTCRACHELHGSDLPAHVAETVPFEGSGWALPIKFEKTATGGGCAPGCHQPMRYDRVAPVMSPAEDAGDLRKEDTP